MVVELQGGLSCREEESCRGIRGYLAAPTILSVPKNNVTDAKGDCTRGFGLGRLSVFANMEKKKEGNDAAVCNGLEAWKRGAALVGHYVVEYRDWQGNL